MSPFLYPTRDDWSWHERERQDERSAARTFVAAAACVVLAIVAGIVIAGTQ